MGSCSCISDPILPGISDLDLWFVHRTLPLPRTHRHLTLCNSTSFRENGLRPITINLSSRQPYIAAEIVGSNGHKVEVSLEIDTGKVDPSH
jgi:hypothetical protein